VPPGHNILATAAGVPFIRTPDSHFADLPDYAFTPQYIEYEGLRQHYVDAGPKHGPVALLMHGMPSWSFLNRHIINALTAQGYRCIAPDHIGFGRSDKVTDPAWYSICNHTRACRHLIETLDLRGITLFAQDWGGPTGLAQPAEMPERFDRLLIMNTWLPHAAFAYSPAIQGWAASWQEGGIFASSIGQTLTLSAIMAVALGYITPPDLFALTQGAPMPPLPAEAQEVLRGYDAPHTGLGLAAYAGPFRFPLSIPIGRPDDPTVQDGARHFQALRGWIKPVHFIWGGKDEIFTQAWGRAWAALYPQASFDLLENAGHFLQETHGVEIARLMLRYAG